jgi:hypothetical protein
MRPEEPPGPAALEAVGARTADPLPSAIAANTTKSDGVVKPTVAAKVFAGKRQIGAVIETSAGFVAWWKGGRAGVFDTYGLAETAVHNAARRKRCETPQP